MSNVTTQAASGRHDVKNVIRIINDYQCEPTEFALVVPVPVVLQKDQIHIGNRELFQRLHAYSSPRPVEYYYPDPRSSQLLEMGGATNSANAMGAPQTPAREDRFPGSAIRAHSTRGGYELSTLTASASVP